MEEFSFLSDPTYQARVARLLGNQDLLAKFVTAARRVVQDQQIQKCTEASVADALLKCAEYKLFPSTVSGEVYILARWNSRLSKNEAAFQLGYKGLKTILYKVGVSIVSSEIIKENDSYDIQMGTDPKIEHHPAIVNRGKPIAVYVVTRYNGEKQFKFMTSDEVLAFRKFSSGYTNKNGDIIKSSPWLEQNDPELNMWKKTCLIQLAKNLPQNEELAELIAEDNKEHSIEDFTKNILQIEKEKSNQAKIDLAARLGLAAPTPATPAPKVEEKKEVAQEEEVEQEEVVEVKAKPTPAPKKTRFTKPEVVKEKVEPKDELQEMLAEQRKEEASKIAELAQEVEATEEVEEVVETAEIEEKRPDDKLAGLTDEQKTAFFRLRTELEAFYSSENCPTFLQESIAKHLAVGYDPASIKMDYNMMINAKKNAEQKQADMLQQMGF